MKILDMAIKETAWLIEKINENPHIRKKKKYNLFSGFDRKGLTPETDFTLNFLNIIIVENNILRYDK